MRADLEAQLGRAMAEAQRLFSKADVRALRPSTSIADSGVVALQDELDRVGQQILLHAMRARTQRLREKPPHGRVDRQLTDADISAGVHAIELRWLDELLERPAGEARLPRPWSGASLFAAISAHRSLTHVSLVDNALEDLGAVGPLSSLVRTCKGSLTNPGRALCPLTGPACSGDSTAPSDWSSVLGPFCSWKQASRR